MTCTLLLTISVLSQTFTVERTYTGSIVSVDKLTYTVNFIGEAEWMTKPLAVPKHRCTKAD